MTTTIQLITPTEVTVNGAIGAAAGTIYGWFRGISIAKAALAGGAVYGAYLTTLQIQDRLVRQLAEKYNWRASSVVMIQAAGKACQSLALTAGLVALGVISQNYAVIGGVATLLVCSYQVLHAAAVIRNSDKDAVLGSDLSFTKWKESLPIKYQYSA